MTRTGKQAMKRTVLSVLVALPLAAQAQTYSKTETIEYHDNTTLWVLGQTAKVTCVAPAECTPSWAPSGIVMSETAYDTLARPVTVKSFGKLTQTLTYDTTSTVASGQLGTLKTVKDGNNNITTFDNWKRGIPQAITHADSTSQSAVVDDRGWIASVTDETGAKTCYTYDAMGRMASITYPSETQAGVCDASKWQVTYQSFAPASTGYGGMPAGYWQQTVTTGYGRKVVLFDALWRPVISESYDMQDVAGTMSQSVTRYDSEGRPVFQSYPQRTSDTGIINTWANPAVPVHASTKGTYTEYDALGRVTSVTQDSELAAPNHLLVTLTEYLPGFKTRVTNPRGQQTLYEYQVFDQPSTDVLTGVTQFAGVDTAATEIQRDVFGKVKRLTRRNADGSLRVDRHYVYQADQLLCKSIEPETGATVYAYDWAGNLTHSASGLVGYGDTTACNHPEALASGRVVIRTYDARNRLKTLSFPDGRGNQTWSYEPDGLPFQIVTSNAVGGGEPVYNTYYYNKRRMPSAENVHQPGWYTWALGYGYDANGNLANQTYPTNLIINYAPNALGQATQARDQAGYAYAHGVSYYPNGAIKQFTYANGIVHTMEQNSRQLPVRVVDGNVVNFVYSFDKNGNVEAIGDYIQGGGDGSHSRWMTYDGLDRLTSVGSCMFGGDCWHRFTYNALDNLTSWKLGGVKDYAGYIYDASNRLIGIQNGAGATTVGLSYDLQGNLANKNGQAYVFDYGNRLREVTGKEWYRYDGHGRRVNAWGASLNLIASQYSQFGQLLYTEDYREGKNHENIFLGGSLVAIREWSQSAQSYKAIFQHTDALGSPVATTDMSGQVVKRNNYEPYGTVISQPNYGGIGYTGHVQDAATGLTYMQQRYYDPTIGRFLSVDPVTAYSMPGSNFNRYWYANNNPYKFNDPDGRVVEYAFKNGATPGDGDAILRHIQKSPTAMSELAQIADSDLTYTISFNRGQGMSYDRETRTVNIDVTSGLKVKSSGKIQSAALGGVHEISHGAQHDRIGTKALERNLEAPVTGEMQNGVYTVKVGISVEEARATKVESKAAKELGEPARKNYHDQSGPVRTCSPTSNKQC